MCSKQAVGTGQHRGSLQLPSSCSCTLSLCSIYLHRERPKRGKRCIGKSRTKYPTWTGQSAVGALSSDSAVAIDKES